MLALSDIMRGKPQKPPKPHPREAVELRIVPGVIEEQNDNADTD